MIYVLWLVGFSQRAIAASMRLRTKQVSGILENSPGYACRADMSDARRTELLAELIAIRVGEDGTKIDGGMLDRVSLKLRPLDGRQSRGPLRRKLTRGR